MRNGFPKWRGTGYYYSRYKPGLGAVFFFVLLFISVVQYIMSWVNYFRLKYYLQSIRNEAAKTNYKQLKKQFKKIFPDSPQLTKKEFEETSAVELYSAVTGLPNPDEIETKSPSITSIILFQLPIITIRYLLYAPQLWTVYSNSSKNKSSMNKEGSSNSDLVNSLHQTPSDVNLDGSKKKEKRRRKRNDQSLDSTESPMGSGTATPNSLNDNETFISTDDAFGDITEGLLRKRILQATKKSSESMSREGSITSENSDTILVEKKDVEDMEKNEGEEEEEGQEIELIDLDREWTTQEYQTLASLTKKYPPGTPGRWVIIAKLMKREVKVVAEKTKELMENPKLGL